MIHIGTVHHRDHRWIEIQLRHLRRGTGEPYRVHASFEGIASRHGQGFDSVLEHDDLAPGEDAGARIELKLEALSAALIEQADPGDLIVFAHGDTLPLPGWAGETRGLVGAGRLAAVRRDEMGEPIPHWSFCATTAGFWEEIGGDFGRGPTWSFGGKEVTDTGASLWKDLERRGVGWRPILRTNRVNLHPVWFGVYGDIVYHHGAGFRVPMSRFDAAAYSDLPVPLRNIAGVRRRVANSRLSRRMYRRARDDDDFYLELTGA